MAYQTPGVDFRTRLQEWIPKLVLSPSLAAMLIFVYGFIVFTIFLSFTDSKMLPSYDMVGFENYAKLWNLSAWWVAVVNLNDAYGARVAEIARARGQRVLTVGHGAGCVRARTACRCPVARAWPSPGR